MAKLLSIKPAFQNPDMRQKYFRLKDMNEHMLKQLENGQQELDVLNSKIEGLQEVRVYV